MHAVVGATFLGLIAALSVLAALFVYVGRPRHASNRLLAAGLFFQGISEGAVCLRLLHDVPERLGGTDLGLRVVFFLGVLSWIMLYLLFLGTLRAPLARPLRSPLGRGIVVSYWSILAAWTILRPAQVLPAEGRPPSLFLIVPVLVMGVYGLLVAWQMWRQTEAGGLERRQATAFLLAFGIRDLSFLVFGLLAAGATFSLIGTATDSWVGRIPAAANLVSALFLTYGILTTQLLDIDIKIKWGIRRGTLLGIFVAAFVATSEIVSELVTEQAGIRVGIIATTALVLAIGPLQRLADRLADRALPHVEDTPEYRVVRRDELYTAAVRSALLDGIVTDQERQMLATLADQLGLTSVQALDLERTVTTAARGEPA